MAEGTRFEPNQSPFFTFSVYKVSRCLKLNRKFREIFSGNHSVPRAKTVGQKFCYQFKPHFFSTNAAKNEQVDTVFDKNRQK